MSSTENFLKKYKKKPVSVSVSNQITLENIRDIAEWCGGTWTPDVPIIRIPTLEGMMEANLGSRVIQGVKGEFYPIVESIFVETYEPDE